MISFDVLLMKAASALVFIEPVNVIAAFVLLHLARGLAAIVVGELGGSQGMVLAAGPGGDDIWLLSPDAGANPGSRVR